ncbi:hypothetical protein M0802_001312 [Mischocyttarus mexicanus]|nr:hypothetical protein M0802_001312 [Mischocyttarus mexicanus]
MKWNNRVTNDEVLLRNKFDWRMPKRTFNIATAIPVSPVKTTEGSSFMARKSRRRKSNDYSEEEEEEEEEEEDDDDEDESAQSLFYYV